MIENIDRKSKILDPDIQGVAALIAENDKYDHQCFLSVVELLKLRARVVVSEREEVEELDRYVRTQPVRSHESSCVSFFFRQ